VGEGNYRAIYQSTSESFLNADPTVKTLHPLTALFLSFDQEFGDIFGGWIRFGVRPDDETLMYNKSLYSGGINISGTWWGREQDNIGLAYAYINGGNAGIDRTQIAEGYVRFGINEFFALTFDLQYMEDKYDLRAGEDVDGIIAGVRLTAEF
jgi:porin